MISKAACFRGGPGLKGARERIIIWKKELFWILCMVEYYKLIFLFKNYFIVKFNDAHASLKKRQYVIKIIKN